MDVWSINLLKLSDADMKSLEGSYLEIKVSMLVFWDITDRHFKKSLLIIFKNQKIQSNSI